MTIKPLKIILVEDSQDLLDGWIELLGLDGHRVSGFLHGSELLKDDKTIESADLLVSDYYLPDLNGVELIRKLRQKRSDLPAILLTGSKDEAIREHVASIPGVLLIYKPLGIEDLERAIGKLLTRVS